MTEPRHLQPTKALANRPASDAATLSDKVGVALDEIAKLEAELEFLEANLPQLQAKIDAAVRPLILEIVAIRQELVRIVERAVNAAPRRSALHRDGADLILHLAADLEERFGVDVRQILARWSGGSTDPENEEEEDDGDDFNWARAESHAPRREAPDPHRNRKRAPLDPEAAAKGIYHSLARELHPDKTCDETERVRRTELMQNLTSAWRERDLGSLLKLLHTHGSDEAKSDAMDATSLKVCLQGLEETRDRLRKKVRDLRHQGLPGGVVDWMPLLRDPKLFDKLLRRQKSIPREELDQLKHWKALWISPGGLDRFFREVPDHMWNQVV